MSWREIGASVPKGFTQVQNIIAVGSGKGGVGKSTLATLLAYSLKERGLKVGLFDADLYGPSQLRLMGRPQQAGPDDQRPTPIERDGIRYISMAAFKQDDSPAIMRAPMVNKWLQFFMGGLDWGELDYLIIDLPPGTGDVQLTIAQQSRLHAAIIVTTANQVASEIAQKGLEMFRQLAVPVVGVVENMSGFVCGHCHEITQIFQGEGAQQLAQRYQLPLLGRIPLHPGLTHTNDGLSELFTPEAPATIKKATADFVEQFLTHYQATKASIGSLTPTEMALSEQGDALRLRWRDQESQVTSYQARLACPCAHCVDEVTGEPRLKVDQIPAQVKILNARPVGHYGLNLHFSDGHNTGIYKFERLQELAQKAPPANPSAAESPSPSAPGEFLSEVQKLVDEQITPALADHGGFMELVDFQEGTLIVRFGGGCQGCSQVDVTVKDGVEKILSEAFPAIKKIADATEHAAGENPYFR